LPDYLDTSAFIKLVRYEPESPALHRELAGRELLSSTLLTVDGRRAARRYGDLASKRARAALTAITLIPLGQPILDAAAELNPAEMRSLDALHLATVVSLGADALSGSSWGRRRPPPHDRGSTSRNPSQPPWGIDRLAQLGYGQPDPGI